MSSRVRRAGLAVFAAALALTGAVLINMHGDGYESVTGSWFICDASDQTTITLAAPATDGGSTFTPARSAPGRGPPGNR